MKEILETIKTRLARITRLQWIIAGAVLAALVIAVLVYFNSGDDNIKIEDGVEYKISDEVILPMHSVKSLDPSASNDSDTYQVAKLVYESLFTLDGQMTPQKQLASSYKFNKEKKTCTVKLIEAKWSDGEQLTGSDVVYTVEKLKDAGDDCNYSEFLSGIDYAESDGNTVTIHFIDSANMALDMLTFPIMPEHKDSDTSSDGSSEDDEFIPVGSGQYKVKSYTPSKELVLVPNENYHGTQAENTLTFDMESMRGDMYQLLQAGGIALCISKDADRESNITNKDVEIKDFPANTVEFLSFDTTDSIVGDKKVRQAICYAINSKDLIDGAFSGSGMVNDNMYFPGYLGIKSSKQKYPKDNEKATKLLEEAGYTKTNKDGYLTDDDGNVLELNFAVDKSNEERVNAAEMIAQDLEDTGIKVNVKEISTASYKTTVAGGGCDIFLGSYTFNECMDMRLLYGYTSTNKSKYYNDELIELMDELRSGETVDEQKETYAEIKEIINDDVPYYCICYRTYGAITQNTFEGESDPIWNNYYNSCGDWKSKYINDDTESD